MDRSSVTRVLVVEDCADTAESLRTLLDLWGHEVRVARDGPAALAGALAFRPTVVLLDLGLPRMDGFEIARQLRELPWAVAPILVAATGHDGPAIRRQSFEAGCQHFLPKPFDLS